MRTREEGSWTKMLERNKDKCCVDGEEDGEENNESQRVQRDVRIVKGKIRGV